MAGDTILSVSVDYMLRMFTHSGWQIDLEGIVEVDREGAAPFLLDKHGPGTPTPAEVSALQGQAIVGVARRESGDLILRFNDLTLTTFVDPDYESWQLYGPRGEVFICGHGGKMTEYDARPEEWEADAQSGESHSGDGAGDMAGDHRDSLVETPPLASPGSSDELKVPDFRGEAVTRISLSNSLKIFTSNDWMFSLEGVLWLTRAGRQTVEIEKIFADPVEPPEQLADLVGEPITGVLVSQGGHLAINFARAQISVEPRPEFEAWQIHGARGELIVCGPGGRVTGWEPADS